MHTLKITISAINNIKKIHKSRHQKVIWRENSILSSGLSISTKNSKSSHTPIKKGNCTYTFWPFLKGKNSPFGTNTILATPLFAQTSLHLASKWNFFCKKTLGARNIRSFQRAKCENKLPKECSWNISLNLLGALKFS